MYFLPTAFFWGRDYHRDQPARPAVLTNVGAEGSAETSRSTTYRVAQLAASHPVLAFDFFWLPQQEAANTPASSRDL